jgi:UDP-GlcNAc:undecaprenyl-phosphate GlcNAc-1-phosphate transferase
MANAWYGLIVGAAAVVALCVSLAACRLVMAQGLLPDEPNHRSSHKRPTSRAGGLAIYAAWISAMAIVGVFAGREGMALEAAKLSGLGTIALLVGIADDLWDMTPAFKFIGQLAAASLFAWIIGPLAYWPLPFLGAAPLPSVLAYGLTLFWIVAFMNAFNFMDGVNGVAGGCAAIGLAVFAVIAGFAGADIAAVSALLLAVACFGFLPANLGRGRLFMGDSGSQMVSFMIAGLAVYGANASEGRVSALVIPVIFIPFIFDVAWTLAHRIIRRKNIVKAHREHLYQLRLRMGLSHGRVALAYMTMTAFAAAAAILMLALPPGDQALAPLVLCAFLALSAAFTHHAAIRAGLFSESDFGAPMAAVQSAE